VATTASLVLSVVAVHAMLSTRVTLDRVSLSLVRFTASVSVVVDVVAWVIAGFTVLDCSGWWGGWMVGWLGGWLVGARVSFGSCCSCSNSSSSSSSLSSSSSFSSSSLLSSSSSLLLLILLLLLHQPINQ